MKNIKDIELVCMEDNMLDKEEVLEKYNWYIENLINPDLESFETATTTSENFGMHVVEWNRMLERLGVLDCVTRVGKKGNKNIDLVGWVINDEHRKYLLCNGLAIEIKETRDAVYWNRNKLTHIASYINILLRRHNMPMLKLR